VGVVGAIRRDPAQSDAAPEHEEVADRLGAPRAETAVSEPDRGQP
jgi:hypothetical protein